MLIKNNCLSGWSSVDPDPSGASPLDLSIANTAVYSTAVRVYVKLKHLSYWFRNAVNS